MPANLTPQYLEAEKRFKEAKDPEQKLRELENMIRLLPKHKGTDHMLADLRRRRSLLKKEIAKARAKAKKGPSFRIPPEGAGQVVILGPPNCGKSSLLRALTNATPEVAPFPFSTREPVPGMMPFENVAIQLIDTPAISSDFMFPWMIEITRNADAALLIADLSTDDSLEQVPMVREQLASKKVELVPDLTREDGNSPVRHLGTLLVGTKCDSPEAGDRFELIQEALGVPYRKIAVSAEKGIGLGQLKKLVFDFLDVIRVYTKVPGKKPDLDAPFVLPRGSTVLDLAEEVHREFVETLKYARVWGEEVYDGQTVKRDYVLRDGDIVELHT